jgi:hypothetical protein
MSSTRLFRFVVLFLDEVKRVGLVVVLVAFVLGHVATATTRCRALVSRMVTSTTARLQENKNIHRSMIKSMILQAVLGRNRVNERPVLC